MNPSFVSHSVTMTSIAITNFVVVTNCDHVSMKPSANFITPLLLS